MTDQAGLPAPNQVRPSVRTVGVEEELLLVQPDDGHPQAVASAALRRADPAARPDDEPGGTLEGELQQQQLELGTRPCTDLGELIDELRHWRALADDAADRAGARVAALATSPVAAPPELTPDARYQEMVRRFGLTAAEQLACGCHVHVSVESDDEAVAVLDRIRVWLPVLLACSANSPFWQGEDSGYASFRSQAWSRWPVAGPTDVFGSTQGYREHRDALLGSQTVVDAGQLYFDARVSEKYQTVEIRAADVCLDVRDTVLIAGLCRAMVDAAADEWRDGRPPPGLPASQLRMAMWRAGRSGLEEDLLDVRDLRPRPAAELISGLLDWVGPALDRNGDRLVVEERLSAILSSGTGARRQRAVYTEAGELRAVVADAVEITRAS